jgi:hypothetical protein
MISRAQDTCAIRLWKMPVVPGLERGQGGVRQIAREIAPDARHVLEIDGLAVAPREAGEDPKNLSVSLGTQRGIGIGEAGAVEIRLYCGYAIAIVIEEFRFEGGRNIDAGVLEQ